MADAGSRVTFFFEFEGGTAAAGWTENFYLQASPSQNLLVAIKNKYIPLRAALLGVGATLKSVRMSSIPATRATQVYICQGTEGQSKSVFTSNIDKGTDTDPTQVDLLLRAQTAEGKRRQFWLAGIPDSATDTGVQQGVVGAFVNGGDFQAWVKACIALNFQIRWKIQPFLPNKLYSATNIITFQPVSIRNRKRGRPFNLYRGRRIA